ncbi:MAG: hypothetical protein ACOYO1_16100 [Bacteroidales bacterium]
MKVLSFGESLFRFIGNLGEVSLELWFFCFKTKERKISIIEQKYLTYALIIPFTGLIIAFACLIIPISG